MGKIAFVFSGQGAQYPGMGEELAKVSPAAKAVFDIAESIRPGTKEECFHGDAEILSETNNTQPCMFAMELACAKALEEQGIRADVAAGFSQALSGATITSTAMTNAVNAAVVTARSILN